MSPLSAVPTQNSEVVVWRGITELDEPLGLAGYATEVNADGSIIVGKGTVSGVANTWFLYDGSNIVDLLLSLSAAGAEFTDWTIDMITDISDDGTILVGYGTNPDGRVQGFRIDLEGTGIAGL